MLLRIASGLLGLAILLTAIWAGQLWVFLFTLGPAILGILEFYRLHPPASKTPEPSLAGNFRQLSGSDGDGLAAPLDPVAESSGLSGPPGHGSGQCQRQVEDVTAGQTPANTCAASAVHVPPQAAGAPLPEVPGESPEVGEPQPSATGVLASEATRLPGLLGAAWVAAFLVAGAAASGPVQFWTISLVIFGAGAFVAALWLIAFYRGPSWPTAAAYMVLGPVYVGFLLAHVLLLVQVGESFFRIDPLYFDPDVGPTIYEVGSNWLMFALLLNFATDSGAYLVGRAIGRHPMAPVTSPNKTWEGAAGGFVCALVAAFLLDRILDLGLGPNALDGAWLSLNWQPLLIGATVGIVSQFGDLLESRLKRLSQVKDSGFMVPGHGGALDRLDSLLITLPTVYYLLVAVLRL